MLTSAGKLEVSLSRFHRQVRRPTDSKSNPASNSVVVKGLIANHFKNQMSKDALFTSGGRLCKAIRLLIHSRIFHFTTNDSIASNSNLCLMDFGRFTRFQDHFNFLICQQIEVSIFVICRVTLYVRTSRLAANTGTKVSARCPFLSRK